MGYRLLFASLPLLLFTVAHSQSPSSLTLEAISPQNEPVRVGMAGDDPADIGRYLLASGAGATRLSPDGQSVAYTHSITGAPQLWITPVAGGQPRQLTFGNGITFFRWAPNSSALIYGADNDGNEQPSFSMISIDGSSERLILPPVSGGFRTFGDFSVDGQTILYASTERNGLDYDIYQANVRTGASELLYEGSYGNFARALSPDGRYVIVDETVGEDSDNLYLLDIETRQLATISKPDPRANHTNGGFAWLPDSSGFYAASNLYGEFTALVKYELGTMRFTTVESADYDIQNVNLCGEGGRFLVWTVNEDGFYKVHASDLTTGNELRVPALPEGVHALSCGNQTPLLAIRTNGWRTPGDINVWNLASGTSQLLFESSLSGLDADRLVRPQSIRMKAQDGVELQGLLYLPDASSRTSNGAPPVVFQVHGGPTGQSVANFDGVTQYHVDRGVAVFKPNVRGSTGFGRTYVTLDDRTNRLDSVRDLVDMLEFFQADGRVDADSAAVAGGSYGGYMVNAVLTAYPGYFKAGVAMYGVADWVTALELASPALKASDRIEYGDINLPEWKSFYEVNSPIRQADAIDVPVLYSHGVMDPRIDIAETEVMVNALRENGIEAPFIRIPDEGHGWRKLSNRLFYYRRQAEFLESQLGGN